MGRLPILCLVILCISDLCFSNPNITVEFERTSLFLRDFLRKMEYSKLVAYVSWSRAECASFSKLLSNMPILHAILKNNVPSVSQFLNKNDRIVILLEMAFNDSVKILQDPNNQYLYKEPYVWILLGNPKNKQPHNVFLPINSMIYEADNTNTSHIVVKAIFKFNRTSSDYLSNDIAEWDSKKGFSYFNKLTPATNRTNFLGAPIRTSYVITNNDSLNHLSNYRHIDTDKLSKINYRLIDSISDLLNASKVNIWTSSWGYTNLTTGEYSDGMFRDLLMNKADIAGTTAFIQENRIDPFRFLVPTTHDKIKFVFRAPPLSYTSNVYTISFSPLFNLSFLATLVLGTVLLYFLVLVEHRCGAIPARMTFMDVIGLQICSITQNGVVRMPQLTAARIAVFFNLIFGMLVYTALSAYIVILLQKTSDEIKDVKGLYDSKMPIGVQNTPYNKYYYTTPNGQTNEYYRRLLYENRLGGSPSTFLSAKRGMKKVQEGFYAYQVELSTAHYFIKTTFKENEKCSIKGVPTIFAAYEPYLAIPKNSSYYDSFQVGFRRLFETGLHQREYVRFFTKEHECQGAQRNYDSVRLMDCYFPFLIFAFGCILSIVVLVLESLVKHLRKKDLALQVSRIKDGYRRRITQLFDFVN